MKHSNIINYNQQIRQYIRQRRRALTIEQQKLFAYQAATRLINCISLSVLHNVALFLSFDGELDTRPLVKYFWSIGKKVYLPCLHPHGLKKLVFLCYHTYTRLILNRLKIYEPEFYARNALSINELDLLVIPLVAFDMQGHRLGMGSGFYDRTLQNWQEYSNLQLIGYAHDCQLVNNIHTEEWDISLSKVITPSKLWIW